MFWRSRALWLKNGAFLSVKYLEIFAMIRLLTSYSKDKRRKKANYLSMSRKVKGQHSCNSLVALSFWLNIPTPLNRRCIYLCKQVKDDDLKTPRTSKDKKCYWSRSITDAFRQSSVYLSFVWILKALELRTCSLLLMCDALSMFWNILFPLHRLFYMHTTLSSMQFICICIYVWTSLYVQLCVN